jgi:hypothetical protein
LPSDLSRSPCDAFNGTPAKGDAGPLANLLRFLILFVAGVAILHKLQPYVSAVLIEMLLS